MCSWDVPPVVAARVATAVGSCVPAWAVRGARAAAGACCARFPAAQARVHRAAEPAEPGDGQGHVELAGMTQEAPEHMVEVVPLLSTRSSAADSHMNGR